MAMVLRAELYAFSDVFDGSNRIILSLVRFLQNILFCFYFQGINKSSINASCSHFSCPFFFFLILDRSEAPCFFVSSLGGFPGAKIHQQINLTITILSPSEVRNGTVRRSRNDKQPPGRQDDSETDELVAGWEVVIKSGYTTTSTSTRVL